MAALLKNGFEKSTLGSVPRALKLIHRFVPDILDLGGIQRRLHLGNHEYPTSLVGRRE